MKNLVKFLAFVFLLAAGVGALYQWRRGATPARRAPARFTPAEGSLVDPRRVEALEAQSRQSTALIRAVVPSVVSITSSRTVVARGVSEEESWGSLGRSVPRTLRQRALGSGTIVSREGHILTNHHVIAEFEEIDVQLADGRRARARVIGSDAELDVALLKVDLPGVIPLRLGDSDTVDVGERVFAVGNPFGLEETVTDGIISAKGRRTSSDSHAEYLQTNAVINQGNSGGPLVDVRGELIGVNTAILASESGAWQGYSFAIPSNTARRAMEELLRRGRIERGYLGITIENVRPAVADALGLKTRAGALVLQVEPDSPGHRAGLRPGDVVCKVDGEPVRDHIQLRNRLTELRPGARVTLTVERAGRDVDVLAQIGPRPAERGAPGRAP